MSRQPLSTTGTNFHDIKQQDHHYHYHYHYHYPPMTINLAHSSYNQCQPKLELTDSISFEPSMPMIDHQVPLKYKENIHRNSTLKLRRCVSLFLHLIGIDF